MARRSRSSIAGGLAKKRRLGEVGAARIGDGRNAHLPLTLGGSGESFQPAHAGFAEAFGIGHDVRLRHRHEILGAEELADLDLMLQRLPSNRAGFAGQDILLFVVQLHQAQSTVAPESRTALPHLTSSAA